MTQRHITEDDTKTHYLRRWQRHITGEWRRHKGIITSKWNWFTWNVYSSKGEWLWL